MRHRVLIADDSPADREFYAKVLAEVDCDYAQAENGLQALEAVRAFQPDLILLDIVLPDISGFEICRILKDDLATRKIVVLMITSLDELAAIKHAIDVHSDDFLTKPVAKADLLKRVEMMLKLKDVRDKFTS